MILLLLLCGDYCMCRAASHRSRRIYSGLHPAGEHALVVAIAACCTYFTRMAAVSSCCGMHAFTTSVRPSVTAQQVGSSDPQRRINVPGSSSSSSCGRFLHHRSRTPAARMPMPCVRGWQCGTTRRHAAGRARAPPDERGPGIVALAHV